MNGVGAALVVCAAIDNNPDNLDYVAFARERYPDRLHVVADLDCTWNTTYHRPGSADRLRKLDDEYQLAGFTHYVREQNDGWLLSDEADAVFRVARERHLVLSLAAGPAWQADLRAVASKYPSVPVLCHHLGGVNAAESLDSPGLAEIIASAAVPNLFVKVSGFHYVSAVPWNHPWPDAVAVFSRIFDVYGPSRLCWGSDFPASKRYCTFRQSLEVVRTNCAFLAPKDLRLVLGENLQRILASV